jgi:hypothetical protein
VSPDDLKTEDEEVKSQMLPYLQALSKQTKEVEHSFNTFRDEKMKKIDHPKNLIGRSQHFIYRAGYESQPIPNYTGPLEKNPLWDYFYVYDSYKDYMDAMRMHVWDFVIRYL